MNSDWPLVQIDEIKAKGKGAIAIGPFGSRMKSNCYVDSGVPVIRGTNLGASPSFINDFVFITKEKADELGSCNVYEGDLVFPHRGSIGEVGIVTDGRYVLSSSLMKLRCDPHKAYPLFIYYFFKSTKGRHELLKNASQVGTPGIGQPLTSLKSIELPLPPLHIQKEIASILEMLDRKIQLNQQINQTLEQMAQAIFKSWFVDFEPVKAKIAALAAGGNEEDALLAAMQAISGKDSDQLATMQAQRPEQYAELRATAELFPSAMQESELGEIPKGWGIEELASQIEILNGFAFKSRDYTNDDGLFVLRTKNFNSEGVAERLSDDVYLPLEFNDIYKKYLCEPFDYHLVMVGASVGKTAMIYPSEIPALRNQNMWCFRPKKEAFIGKGFTKYITDLTVSRLKGVASGSAREFFRKGDFQSYKICIGNELIQSSFEKTVFCLLQSKANYYAEAMNLAKLRDILLPKLLSGDLFVSNGMAAFDTKETVHV